MKRGKKYIVVDDFKKIQEEYTRKLVDPDNLTGKSSRID